MTQSTHLKGVLSYSTSDYEEGGRPLQDALAHSGVDVHYLPNHLATRDFPDSVGELQRYDVVILSDCPADTLLLRRETFFHGERTGNRLEAICDYVEAGGGFLMVGGYMSFGGFEGKANYRLSPVARVLPVRILTGDDRVECPQGVTPAVVDGDHPVTSKISRDWPWFLGYNRLELRAGAKVLLQVQDDPFLALWQCRDGRSAAFASDCSPHWGSPAFIAWKDYATFWLSLVTWLSGRGGSGE